ncbi:18228_t:CDS:1, partial [Cetraspora pellucida]
HDFEKLIVKLLNNNGFVAQLVECRPGDFGSDIFVSYKKNLIIIQCKNQKSKIGIEVIQRIHSVSIGRFKDSLGVIVYNSNKLKDPLTKDAKIWYQGICSEILI